MLPNGTDPNTARAERTAQYQRIIKGMWYALGAGLGFVILLFLLLSFSDLPDTQELENPKSELASEVLDANGEVLGRYYIENRVPVAYEALPPHLVAALISTEDVRYMKHSGIDLEAVGRVLFKTMLLRQRSTGGGSTITQQLAKLLFTGKKGSGLERVFQKFREWIIAVRLERKYTKEEILAMYLNKFDFLNEADGIKAAAEIYFGASLDSLKVEEAATLVGMLKNPSLFNPITHPDTTLHRRMVVLAQMKKYGHLTQEQYDSLRQLPLDMSRFKRSSHTAGLAPYFRAELSKEIDHILSRPECKKPDGSNYNLYRDGLRIETSIDPAVQTHMETAMVAHMRDLQKKFNKHWEKMDPWEYKDGETTPGELTARKRKLERMIRETERYAKLRNHYLSQPTANIEAEMEKFRLRDVDIDRMLEEEKEPGFLNKLVENNLISRKMSVQYRDVMQSAYWIDLKEQWEKLQEATEKEFKTPVNMRVFTYENDKFEKDTLMSPLDSLKYHHQFLQIGALAVNPINGQIKGWVGGINFKYFKYDHVHTETRRQVGSTFKPFIYATAIAQQSISPCFQVPDVPQTILPEEGQFGLLKEWTPSNSDGKYSGNLYTLKDGLRHSKNTVSVYLMKQLTTTDPVRELVDRMGIDKDVKYPNGRYVLPQTPSICLGATDLSVVEMTGAYTTFANDGIFNKPHAIVRITDRNGKVIFEEEPEENRALDERANYVMVDMLKYAGTGLGELKSEVGGKTGTTNDYVDGWFMGITPSLVIGTWVGGEDRWIRFRSITYGQGAVMAKPFFKKAMLLIENDPNADYDVKARFSIPKGDLGIELDCSRYASVNNVGNGDNEYSDPGEDMFGDQAIKKDSTELEEQF